MSSVTPAYLLRTFHGLQVLLAGYGAYNSYNAVTNLQEYEETTRKAAKWSNEAQHQLDRTRTTQGAGVLSITLSVATSMTLAFAPAYLPPLARYLASPVLLVGLVATRQYIIGYWGPSGGIRVPLPMMGDYNVAQQKTKVVLDVLEWLEYSWIVTSFGWGLIKS